MNGYHFVGVANSLLRRHFVQGFCKPKFTNVYHLKTTIDLGRGTLFQTVLFVILNSLKRNLFLPLPLGQVPVLNFDLESRMIHSNTILFTIAKLTAFL